MRHDRAPAPVASRREDVLPVREGLRVNASLAQPVRFSSSTIVRKIIGDPSSRLFVAQIATAASAFTANILAARALGPSGRGELALLLQIAYFGSLGVLLGTDRSVVAVYTGQSPRTVTRAFIRLLLRPSAVTVLVVVALLLLPLQAVSSWRLRLSVAAVFLLVNAFSLAVRSIAIASGRSQGYLVYALTAETLRIGGLVAAMALGFSSSSAWLLPYVLAGFLSGAAWLWWWGRSGGSVGESPPAVANVGQGATADENLQRRARREGLHLLPGTIAHSGTLRLDRLILAALASTAALGLYASVATIVELIIWPLLVFADSRLGVWRQAYDRGGLSLRRVITLAVGYSVAVGAALATALHFLLVPVLGASYAPALALVVPLTLANAVFGISQILVTALTAIRRAALSSAVEVVGVSVSVVAYVGLIHRFGALGAAYGSLIGYTSCLVAAAVLLVRARSLSPTAAGRPPATLAVGETSP